MNSVKGVAAKPPTIPPMVNVHYSNLTAAEKARVQAQIKQAMAQMNYTLGQGGSIKGGHIGAAMGTQAQQARETKQPQDKVLRLVTSRHHKKLVITSCVTWSVYLGLFAVLFGAVLSEGRWWVLPMVALPVALGIGNVWYWVNKFFKEAEAKADLLNWPEE